MSAITFDTLRFAERLEKAGLTREQATAIAEAQKDVFAEALDSQLATKSDIVRLDGNMIRLDGKITLVQWMLALVIAAEAMPLLATLFK